MFEANPADEGQVTSSVPSVAALARETETSIDLVRALDDQAVADLAAGATIRQYFGLIATRRVKRRLKARSRY